MGTVPKIDNGISAKDREAISEALSKVLADSFVLYLKTHNYHWNVTGPMFQTLHIMFMEQYTELWNALDQIAERIRSLGFKAPGSFKEFQKLSSMKEGDSALDAGDMIRDIIAGQDAVARSCRAAMALANKADDQPTVDTMVQRLQVHEKTAWMLRSLIDDSASVKGKKK
ncbi:MAG: DNA starvation/stationary phase protection protein [Oxalobacter sp.]|nr:MAG: DNA starvation/stationary phase protection protein [Oxalobacter sp.]